jgi:hypothetical protein
VLPLLTLYSYLSTFVCRDLQRSVDGRILKVRVLTEMGLFTEAFIVLQRLLHGERLPHIGDSNFRQVESKMSSLKFNTAKPITEPSNLKVRRSNSIYSYIIVIQYLNNYWCHTQYSWNTAQCSPLLVIAGFADQL